MLQLKNNTPFAAQLALFPNPQGVDSLYIMLKASFNIGAKWTLADEQKPPQVEDKFWTDDPTTSSLKLASEFHTGKPSTDIILLGHAWSPSGKEVQQMDVSLAVGAVNKTVRVIGDRQWLDGSYTRPEPFTSMPLVYEKAFGGTYKEADKIIAAESCNPVGCGFTGKRRAKDVNGEALPNLEDPQQLIQQVGDVVAPACFAFISPSWQPRLNYAGTYDEAWKKSRAPYLPLDFDPRFFNMAHPDLIYPGYLSGGETVHISGVNPEGPLVFQLPVIGLSASVDIHGRIEKPPFHLETLLIEADSLQLSMTWRAVVSCDKAALKIRQVAVNLSRSQGQQAA